MQKIDEDKLFNLFSMYGNIVRIKILRNKPDHALVQMADGLQAELAVHYLKVLWGHFIPTLALSFFHPTHCFVSYVLVVIITYHPYSSHRWHFLSRELCYLERNWK